MDESTWSEFNNRFHNYISGHQVQESFIKGILERFELMCNDRIKELKKTHLQAVDDFLDDLAFELQGCNMTPEIADNVRGFYEKLKATFNDKQEH